MLLSMVRGGLISLPWVMAADLLPKRHFSKLALAITLLGTLGGWLSLLNWGAALGSQDAASFIWITLIESIVLAAVVAWRPCDRGTGRWIRWWNKRIQCEDRGLQ